MYEGAVLPARQHQAGCSAGLCLDSRASRNWGMLSAFRRSWSEMIAQANSRVHVQREQDQIQGIEPDKPQQPSSARIGFCVCTSHSLSGWNADELRKCSLILVPPLAQALYAKALQRALDALHPESFSRPETCSRTCNLAP